MRRAKGTILSRPQSNTPGSREQQSSLNLPINTDISDQWGSSGPLTPPLRVHSGSSLSQQDATDDPVYFLPAEVTRHPDIAIPTSAPPVRELVTGLLILPFASLNPNVSGAAILYHPLNSNSNLADRHIQDVIPFQTRQWPSLLEPCQSIVSNLPSGSISEVKDESDPEDYLEGAKQEMYLAPILDPNTVNNTLPFILQSRSMDKSCRV
ncbi:hypothetical protein B0J17DRAFT_125070 [Rhizoctonia solani]|nr:hypothetical protein B0J17DRAFT_125070 [Rhizoctonia solani]